MGGIGGTRERVLARAELIFTFFIFKKGFDFPRCINFLKAVFVPAGISVHLHADLLSGRHHADKRQTTGQGDLMRKNFCGDGGTRLFVNCTSPPALE